MTELLLASGVARPLLLIAVFTVEGALRPEYRPWRHFVSLLAHGERGWVQSTNFFVCGALSLAFAVGCGRASDSVALPISIAVFGAGLIASARYRCDRGLGYPPGAPATWPTKGSPTGNRHNLAGFAVFASLAAASFVAASHAEGPWRTYCIASGVLELVLFVVTGVLAERDARGQAADPPIGVTQRLSIVIGWTWLAALAWRLLAG
jgi:hypothetical protein